MNSAHRCYRLPFGGGPLLFIVIASFVLRILLFPPYGFWGDELFGAAFANLSFPEVVVANLRFDLHPPLWYINLAAWAKLGTSDFWLLLNSAVWSTGTVYLVALESDRRWGRDSAIVAALLCAVLPSEIFYSGELRMYSAMSFAAVCCWIFANRLRENYNTRNASKLVAALATTAALHSAAFVIVACVTVYTFRRNRLWLYILAGGVLSIFPWILNAAVRSASHLTHFSLSTVISTTSQWFALGSIGVILAGLSVILSKDRRTVFCFIVLPLVAVGICSLIRPIWIDRLFVFSGPFLCIAIATRVPLIPASFLVALLLAVSCTQSFDHKKWELRELSAELQGTIRVPESSVFWGVARYKIGTNWNGPMRIQDKTRPDNSDRWRRIYESYPSAIRYVGLDPTMRVEYAPKSELVVGWSDWGVRRFWVVGSSDLKLSDVEMCKSVTLEKRSRRGVVAFLQECL